MSCFRYQRGLHKLTPYTKFTNRVSDKSGPLFTMLKNMDRCSSVHADTPTGLVHFAGI